MSAPVTVLGVGGAPLADAARAVLASAQRVVATRVELAAVRGLVPPGAVVDVLGDTAMEDPEGHRWDLPVEPESVVVLTPPGDRVWRVLHALTEHIGSGRVAAFPPDRGEVEVEALPLAVVGLDLGQDPLGALPPVARRAIADARVVAGGARQLAALEPLLDPSARRLVLGADLDPALDEIAASGRPAVVLASGDPGFFGVLRALRERVPGAAVAVFPAVSSVARVAAAAGEPWDDALVVSAHGRDPAVAVNTCRRHPKVAVLTAPGFGPAELALALDGTDREFVVAERLGLPDEAISRVPAEVARTWRPADPNVVLVLDPSAPVPPKGRLWPSRRTPAAWALPEDAFAHRSGMITKVEVRALVLAWLGPGVGDLVWDVGAGSGSVSVECARLGAAAIAVERDPGQCARIRQNAERHGVPVRVVEGEAPAALDRLPAPDAVFVGGGGDGLPELLAVVAARGPRVVVAALATVERVAAARAALADAGLAVEGTLLQASRLTPLGGGTRLAATNPVVVLRGRRP